MPIDEYMRQSALAALGLAAKARAGPAREAGVVLRECSHRAQLCSLRGGPGTDFEEAVEAVLGVRPPAESASAHGDRGHQRALARAGRTACSVPGRAARGNPLGAARRARSVACRGSGCEPCPFDHRVVGCTRAQCAAEGLPPRSASLALRRGKRGPVEKFARCQVLLHQTDDAPAYDLYVQRSFARYLWSWLEDAAAEYAVRIEG